MITECPHGFPSPKSCVDCMYEDGVVTPDPEPAVEITTKALFRGICPDCGGWIEENMDIRLGRDQRWYHAECD